MISPESIAKLRLMCPLDITASLALIDYVDALQVENDELLAACKDFLENCSDMVTTRLGHVQPITNMKAVVEKMEGGQQ